MSGAKALYEELKLEREPFLKRARECAALTLPTLLVDEDHTAQSETITPYQSFGARAVNNLSSKFLLSLFPPSTAFFRLRVEDDAAEIIEQDDKVKLEIDEALRAIEQRVMVEIETTAIRINAFEAFKHLLTVGNVLVYLRKEGGIRVFHLPQYVIERSPDGDVVTIVTCEKTYISLLQGSALEAFKKSPQGQAHFAKVAANEQKTPEEREDCDEEVEIYTVCRWMADKDRWHVCQEIDGVEIEGTEGTYRKDAMPYIPLRMSAISGESYGRGLVEEYFGDLVSLEGLSQSIVEGAAAVSKLLVMVKPNGMTRKEDVEGRENGAVVDGDPEDVAFLQSEKALDLRVAAETRNNLILELSKAWLLNSSVQRQGERVTAEEIRYMAQELEDALGGVYSVLALEFQLPLVQRLLARLQKANKIPALPKKVRPVIVTGLEALSRGHELSKLDTFIRGAIEFFGPEIASRHFDMPALLLKRATAIGVDAKQILKSPEQLAEERNQAAAMELAQKLGPPAIGAAAKMPQAAAGQPQQQ